MRVSHSRLKTWRCCPNQFRYKYEMDLRPKRKSLPLERGSWIHKLLMTHYDGEDWREEHARLTRTFNNLWEEEREMLGDLPAECGRIMKSYIYTYGKADARRYVVVDSEMDEVVTLPNGLEINIVVDLVVWDRVLKGLWPWDHKTRKNFEDNDNFILDPQLSIYYDGLQIMGYKPLLGVVGNEIRTKAPTVPALLKRGGLSKAKSIDTDVRTYLAAIKRHGLDQADYETILRTIAAQQKNRFFRRTFIPKDPPVLKQQRREVTWSANEILRAKRLQAFPRTQDKSCAWGCDYRDVCIAELKGGDISSMVKMNFTTKRRARKGDE